MRSKRPRALSSRDRFRTTSNVLDDCFAAAVVEKLTEKELKEMELPEQQPVEL